MLDQGFLEREHLGDLRDLIARPHAEHAAVTVNSTESVMAAYRRMKLYDVSQLPVMHDGRIVGIVDEEDILLEVVGNSEHFNEPVTRAMDESPGHGAGRRARRAADGDLQARHGGDRHARQ